MQTIIQSETERRFEKFSQVAEHPWGQGLVALESLPAGVAIAQFAGPTVPFHEIPPDQKNHALGLRGGWWLVPETNARFINHACAANCEVWEDLTVVTTRPIDQGEEFSISYDLVELADFLAAPEEYVWHKPWSFDCLCGSPHCRRRIETYRIVQDNGELSIYRKLAVGKSKGRGQGVFATEDFCAGEIIEVAPVLIVPPEQWRHIEPTALFSYSFTFGPEGEHAAIALGLGSIYNHSYTPNAEYIPEWEPPRIRFRALREIQPGEEITINYNRDPADDSPMWFEVKN